MLLVIEIFATLLVLGILSGFLRTWQIQNDEREKIFLAGTVPNPVLDGLYYGAVPGHTVSWLGKKFYAAREKGINVFSDGKGGEVEQYPFVTSVGKGLHEKNLDVLKIDYDIPGNPVWLRLVVDEVVQVAPGWYLGKLEARMIPGYPFALTYFELKQ